MSEYPLRSPGGESSEARGRAIDEHEFEPVLWLAARGHLLPAEADAIRTKALEASTRVGTDSEQRGSSYAVSNDRSAVRLAIRVDRALGEPSGDYGSTEPPYNRRAA